MLAAVVLLAGCSLLRQSGHCDLAAANAVSAGEGCAQAWMDRSLHLNDILTVGTHNSYKQAIHPKILAAIAAKSAPLAAALDYTHPPLNEELDDGARALELDVVYDPLGGRFAHPVGVQLSGEALSSNYVAAMSRPGFKVMHVPDIDFHSSCLTFVDCLSIIRTWSKAHPRHIPILITLNAKDDKTQVPGGAELLKFDEAAYDALDGEIASVFPRRELITPDDVQGRYPTLREAVLKQGWPTLGEARGKFLFALDEPPEKVAVYRGKRRSLEGRMMFVNTDENSPAAAYLTLNEIPADAARIAAAVKAGFLVRTRADADTVEARKNDSSRREGAFASGAQVVSTDYRHPDIRFGPYEARLPGDVIALCNPQRTPERCAATPIEP
ncbi:MAG: phosphatidylinositol-specific phospholipase C1-like protein [Proteobacteria bacterium]|nr:phosphatidylinositol-specific phospholipase C1-like protein [Pseudomonadota bacterium]